MISLIGKTLKKGTNLILILIFVALIVVLPILFLGKLSNYAFAGQEQDKPHFSSNHLVNIDSIPSKNTSLAPKLITVKHGIDTYKKIVYCETVEDALLELDYANFENYQIKPDLDTPLTSRTNIVIKDYKVERKIEYEIIPFSSKSFFDNSREIDTTTIVQEGREGKKELLVEYIYIDGILEEKNIIEEKVVKEAKDKITALGTKKVFREQTINGDTFEYWKKIRVYATSYDSSCEGCSNYTATGAYLKKGVIAVDPEVIPMYTNMYVPGYGFGQALDVGGAVKGKHIDLGFEDLLNGEWSARYVDIYILD